MESNIRNLPLIPDGKTFYIVMSSIIECFDQMHTREDFINDLRFITQTMDKNINSWKKENLIQ